MKKQPLHPTTANPLHKLIIDATGAEPRDLAQIENIMRDDIFHSTLDWQTSAELRRAARKAFRLLNENRELYDLNHAEILAIFQRDQDKAGVR